MKRGVFPICHSRKWPTEVIFLSTDSKGTCVRYRLVPGGCFVPQRVNIQSCSLGQCNLVDE